MKTKNRTLITWGIEKKVVCSFLCLYILTSQIFLRQIGTSEIFPIFDWHLFSRCGSHYIVPELEVSYFNETTVQNITHKQFSWGLHYRAYHLTKKLFNINMKSAKAYEIEQSLLNRISASLNLKSFKYKIFKSNVPIVSYVKKNILKKEHLFKEGTFNLNQRASKKQTNSL